MIWVYAEGNPFSQSTGSFVGQVEYLAASVEALPASSKATAKQLDAVAFPPDGRVAFITDPPYYDNVPYADLSDFFYVWLRRAGGWLDPQLFSTLLVPKSEELIAEPARHGGRPEANRFFEKGLKDVFRRVHEAQDPEYPFVFFYAFKQSEDAGDQGVVSTGWETMLQGLIDMGYAVTATWPVRTEQPGGLREVGRNALASSIALVCRLRPNDAPLATRRELVAGLRAELPQAMRELQHGNIAPVDLAQASIGPGMAVFSRYAKVIEADGSAMGVRAALGIINQALDEVLAEQDADLDPDSRWAVAWFSQYGTAPGPFGSAETLSKAKNTSVAGMVDAQILQARAGKVRLLCRADLDTTWDPTTGGKRVAIWSVAHHLLIRLETGGEEASAHLLHRIGGSVGELARDLVYRLYVIAERNGWAEEALAYNSLIVAWPEIARRVAGTPEAAAQESLGL